MQPPAGGDRPRSSLRFSGRPTSDIPGTREERAAQLEFYGTQYGQRHLAIAFTRSLSGPYEYKQARSWKDAHRLADGPHGAALLRGRGMQRNPAVCLQASGLVGVDIDGPMGERLAREVIRPDLWPVTVTVVSGRRDGGMHLWYRANGTVAKHKIQLAHSLTRSADGYFICPPAWHTQAGRMYEFMEGRAPWEIEIAEWPGWLDAKLAALDFQRDMTARTDDQSPIAEGERHAHLLRIAGGMRNLGAGEPAILAALISENERRCSPPKSRQEVEALAHDIAGRYPPGSPFLLGGEV